mmetsp:Transcript_5311/g.12909  ORF Transcript_5311/g.12909 Transcript_5311/m.12909 type:complete len:457 (+) Transcript_5311:252-1622(+)|eukprot:CAMPEP_0198369568 /NCGR_PEP_ID=MMETSP1450-20131203/156273_1 /TAXON_ID=753684 ORGANISM="Madagascaria erythrocladiodes, Strain CCMP3234" /NCGR_SAMPLE_ID=MMETSP1450 /ASSEMBLY_ACC=CAM_ASM_001115 /LENGTH=456 /DNA_ID=CAMNT_0044077091 /DNA_START=223 /DNA_END=1593 /DNA_ORIENTATION=+
MPAATPSSVSAARMTAAVAAVTLSSAREATIAGSLKEPLRPEATSSEDGPRRQRSRLFEPLKSAPSPAPELVEVTTADEAASLSPRSVRPRSPGLLAGQSLNLDEVRSFFQPLFGRQQGRPATGPNEGEVQDRGSTFVTNPRHLLVLVHGLTGMPNDLGCLQKVIEEEADVEEREILIHATDVNIGKTHDGVEAGGCRVAEDVAQVAAQYPSLERISMIGFSLGGIYTRYAVAKLFDRGTGKIAGLSPAVLMTVASPHLGVRSFGFYRFAPKELHFIAQFVAGRTGMDMMLVDGENGQEPLLLRMSKDTSELPFLEALRVFEQRVLYANCQHDLMVPYGTAALDTTMRKVVDNAFAPPKGAVVIDEKHDEQGCRVWYEISESPALETEANQSEEEQMAESLRSVSWRTVGVDFQVPIPLIAHNRIIAMMRNPIEEWVNSPGRRAVNHMIGALLGEN